MTKKDYELIARTIRTCLIAPVPGWEKGGTPTDVEVGYARKTLRQLAYSLASQFGADNPRFDRARFLGACGL